MTALNNRTAPEGQFRVFASSPSGNREYHVKDHDDRDAALAQANNHNRFRPEPKVDDVYHVFDSKGLCLTA